MSPFFTPKKEGGANEIVQKESNHPKICNLIPGHSVQNIAKKYEVDKQARAFSPWSHVVSLFFAQLSHALSLNDVCDTLGNHEEALNDIRGAVPQMQTLPYRNRATLKESSLKSPTTSTFAAN